MFFVGVGSHVLFQNNIANRGGGLGAKGPGSQMRVLNGGRVEFVGNDAAEYGGGAGVNIFFSPSDHQHLLSFFFSPATSLPLSNCNSSLDFLFASSYS